eukprot:scaffold938_cov399-Prasinococcus_capsulatus_cf.AAC.5
MEKVGIPPEQSVSSMCLAAALGNIIIAFTANVPVSVCCTIGPNLFIASLLASLLLPLALDFDPGSRRAPKKSPRSGGALLSRLGEAGHGGGVRHARRLLGHAGLRLFDWGREQPCQDGGPSPVDGMSCRRLGWAKVHRTSPLKATRAELHEAG